MAKKGHAKPPVAVAAEEGGVSNEALLSLLRCGCYVDSLGVIAYPVCRKHR